MIVLVLPFFRQNGSWKMNFEVNSGSKHKSAHLSLCDFAEKVSFNSKNKKKSNKLKFDFLSMLLLHLLSGFQFDHWNRNVYFQYALKSPCYITLLKAGKFPSVGINSILNSQMVTYMLKINNYLYWSIDPMDEQSSSNWPNYRTLHLYVRNPYIEYFIPDPIPLIR